jgi:3-aminobutyryl-CoA ammonia-lyase
MKATLRLRLSGHDAHYGGGLVDGARVLSLFGDVCTELCIRQDGDEGLLRAYTQVEFLAPVYAGDFLEVSGELVRVGRSSREMNLAAYKVITPQYELDDSAAIVLDEPILVCRAIAICVVPLEKQRRSKA